MEGGHIAIKRYVKLMMRRIKWADDENEESGDEDSDMEDDEDTEKVANVSSRAGCQLVWQGIIQKQNFHNFRFQECKGSDAARKLLGQRGIAHYWVRTYIERTLKLFSFSNIFTRLKFQIFKIHKPMGYII